MFVIVGLGNPGEEYAHTRHNAGFEVVDLLGQRFGAHYWKKACGCELAECKARVAGQVEQVVLAKPQSFMNLSGGPVLKLLKTYVAIPDDLIVVHDELDIPAGTIRVKFGGGHAGHNGLRSIIDKCASRDFYRVRIGVGRPPGKMKVPDYVLSVPRKQEADLFADAVATGADAVEFLLQNGLAKTQQQFN